MSMVHEYDDIILYIVSNPCSHALVKVAHMALHKMEVWPCSLLLAHHFQVLILISLKMVTDSSKNGRWIIPLKK